MTQLISPRLILRPWGERDSEPFARMSSDPLVMRYFPSTLNRAQVDALIARLKTAMQQKGYGIWVVEAKQTGDFIGCVGLQDLTTDFEFYPGVELAWRLQTSAWGHGYATEAAKACVDFGFNTLGLEQLVAFTSVANMASQKVMQRLGMQYSGTFYHPKLEKSSHLCEHVLYSIGNHTD